MKNWKTSAIEVTSQVVAVGSTLGVAIAVAHLIPSTLVELVIGATAGYIASGYHGPVKQRVQRWLSNDRAPS